MTALLPPPAGPLQEAGEFKHLHRRVYRLRVLGMALAALCIAAVLHENQASLWVWGLLLFTGLLWPQLALWLSARSTDPYRTELRNLLFDSALAGAWVPLMEFNLLPSVLILTLATVDKISTGVPRLWLVSLLGMAAGLLLAAWATGFAHRPITSMPVMLACLPMLLIHSIAVSQASYRLVRKVRQQNHLLNELSRLDMLTGLNSRGYWQQQAERSLQHHRDTGEPATLMMIDIDHFKSINDAHGHAVGDEILSAVASVIRDSIRHIDSAGRFGGDEFGLVLLGSGLRDSGIVAERIRQGVETIAPSTPGLRCTVSIGMAEAENNRELRDWMEAADTALYRAKSEGRNCVVRHAQTTPETATIAPLS